MNENWGWSVQVAGEFYNVVTSTKRQFQLPHSTALEYVKTWLQFPTASLHPTTVLSAMELRERFQLSYWDATIIAAARELGCRTIYSEDFSHAQDYGGIMVMNPFVMAPAEGLES